MPLFIVVSVLIKTAVNTANSKYDLISIVIISLFITSTKIVAMLL